MKIREQKNKKTKYKVLRHFYWFSSKLEESYTRTMKKDLQRNRYFSKVALLCILRMLFWYGKYLEYELKQKKLTKAVRIMITFSDYRAHTSPLFKSVNLLKLLDIVKLHTGIFMLCYSNGLLPVNFDQFFGKINIVFMPMIRGCGVKINNTCVTYTPYQLLNFII